MAVEITIGNSRVVIAAGVGQVEVLPPSERVVVSSAMAPATILDESESVVISSSPASPVTVILAGETVQVGASITGGQVNTLANAGTISLVGVPAKIDSALQLKGLLDSPDITWTIVGNDAQADVTGFTETGGPTNLTYAAVPDGFVLSRSGTDIVGIDPSSFSSGGGGGVPALFLSEPGPSETQTPGFFTDAGFTVGQLNAVLTGSSTPSVTWTMYFDAGPDRTPGGGTEVITGGTTTTSTTTGDEITSFDNAVVPAGSHVWIETTAQSGTVGGLTVTITPA